MAFDPSDLPAETRSFLAERHLATLTLVFEGEPHTTPVGFSWDGDAGLARVITWSGSNKARRLHAAGEAVPATLCQLDGRRWLTLEGTAVVTADPARCAEAVARYSQRYQPPRRDRGPDRRAIEVTVRRVLGSVG